MLFSFVNTLLLAVIFLFLYIFIIDFCALFYYPLKNGSNNAELAILAAYMILNNDSSDKSLYGYLIKYFLIANAPAPFAPVI